MAIIGLITMILGILAGLNKEDEGLIGSKEWKLKKQQMKEALARGVNVEEAQGLVQGKEGVNDGLL